MSRPVLAVTLGDPVGIGPEITAMTLAEYAGDDSHHGVAVGDAVALRRAVEACRLDVEVREVSGFDVEPA
ncbi:MAG: 4-phospho-D-threonate 3-dehydrogenase, partial [Actinomycetota bacterium]|nr:4-phospho-D-threonate 3-dehydrogenase [Actinomycetota bacterium]